VLVVRYSCCYARNASTELLLILLRRTTIGEEGLCSSRQGVVRRWYPKCSLTWQNRLGMLADDEHVAAG